ncbi:MAG: cytochrome c1 [Alyxoria varia]|nr:MAG: cytochrome c1 [Alyxoria varia]
MITGTCLRSGARSIGAGRGISRRTIAKRFNSSSSSTDEASAQWKNTAAAFAASALAVSSAGWYWYAYGRDAHAMTPAEEGTLVGTVMTVDEAKALAEENEYDTEPNDEGEIEQRPGKLSDYIPPPYKNDQAARAANQGALPPDLSLMVKARHGGCNYIFSLLTGYPEDPPPGASVPAGLNFNPYFPGTGIGMARVLYDGLVEYEDGTPATTSQMAKDVVEFLNWTAEPEMDDRKKMGWKALTVSVFLFAISVWVKRYKWAPIKSRKIVYTPPSDKQGFQPASLRPPKRLGETSSKKS